MWSFMANMALPAASNVVCSGWPWATSVASWAPAHTTVSSPMKTNSVPIASFSKVSSCG